VGYSGQRSQTLGPDSVMAIGWTTLVNSWSDHHEDLLPNDREQR
jgi:hypothetical protein